MGGIEIQVNVAMVGVLGLAVLVAAPVFAASARGAPEIEISHVNGSGCPDGSATVEADADGFVVRYSAYAVRIGGDARPSDARRNCRLGLKVTPPEGLTYAVAGSDHRGFMQLESGVRAIFRSAHHYGNHSDRHPLRRDIKGPGHEDWVITETRDETQFFWVPCGEKWGLILSTELALSTSNTSKASVMDMNSGLGSAYRFAWRTCP
ncbi:uncharacterized protein DUF4360 [Actinomadura pelletieri DSM 43383]|uniref:Uncharacterized protein DUF4360 n=1 Tax=Actinomadura pelletieri DSM 43383 TaxID=1120940 RepID=A0A495QHL2_9ACTN|nr:DUF4360 domain-containing protein [Actinomadura pelletieri]RKS71649.1 uncharacterized protein DUF4360 [Actinomadura pelletieri DSM 43383]